MKGNCPKCKHEVSSEAKKLYYSCPGCSGSLYFDGEEFIPHFILEKKIAEDTGEKIFRDWLFNKGFKKEVEVVKKDFMYFPFWVIKTKNIREVVQDSILPACFSEFPEVNRMSFKGGELTPYNEEIARESDVRSPSGSFTKRSSEWLKSRSESSLKILDRMLLHLPIILLQCRYQKMDYTGLVDVTSGDVIVDVFPYKPTTRSVVAYIAAVLLLSTVFVIELTLVENGVLKIAALVATGALFYFLLKMVFVRL